MKNTILLFLTIAVTSAQAQPKSYDYAYVNKKGICVYAVYGKTEILIDAAGSDPCISPDGKKLAYTATDKQGERFIAVTDLNSKKKIIFNTKSNNCYGPMWSPNGQYIAYNVFNVQNSSWSIAIIDSGNTSFKVLTASLPQSYSPTWTADNKNIVAQDMEKVYLFDLDGTVVRSYKISDMTKDLSPSSADRFQLTADGRKIVFSSEVDEAGGTDGPPTAVFVYDINTKTTRRLSPRGYFCSDILVKGNKVLFTTSKLKSPTQNISSVNMDGTNFKVLFPGCSNVSGKM